MTNSKSRTIGTLKDHSGRPLVIIRRTKKGTVMYIFRRYNDMTEDDKDIVRHLHSYASSNVTHSSEDGSEQDVESFLSFLEQKPCG